ncbi:MAG TPA: prepilin peptidase [Anaerolineae bacterium]|nr:prepilin peptidase [Anaerolineae bacterium]
MEILVSLLGLGVGGLVNVLADSLPRSRRPERPHCPSCTAPRPLSAWLGLVALFTKGWRCLYCDTPRNWRTPLIEIVMMAGALWLYIGDPFPTNFWPAFIIFSIFLLITVIDIEHRLILHVVTGPSALLIGLFGVLDPERGFQKTLVGGVVGFGVVLGLYLLGGVFARLVARLRGQILDEVAFGFGDVTLAGVLGLSVGYPGILIALFLGILAAGEYSLVHILFMFSRRKYKAFVPFPYGPFLVLGASIVYFGRGSLEDTIFPFGPLWFLGLLIVFFTAMSARERLRGTSKTG